MRYRALPIVSALILAASAASSPAPAAAAGTPLQICNQTSVAITVAISYVSSGQNDTATTLSGPTVSTGWWAVAANQCNSMPNPFAARYVYWWGYNANGALWTDTDANYIHFCVPDIFQSYNPQFTFEDQNASSDACTSAPPDAAGPNMWVLAREVDLDVNATVDYSQ